MIQVFGRERVFFSVYGNRVALWCRQSLDVSRQLPRCCPTFLSSYERYSNLKSCFQQSVWCSYYLKCLAVAGKQGLPWAVISLFHSRSVWAVILRGGTWGRGDICNRWHFIWHSFPSVLICSLLLFHCHPFVNSPFPPFDSGQCWVIQCFPAKLLVPSLIPLTANIYNFVAG